MERQQQQRGGEEQPDGAALALPPEAGGVDHAESWDERVIREGIDAAVSDGRAIDDRTARYIAGQLHGGQASALYALASSGAIQSEVFDELDRDRTQQAPLVRRWIACLTVYCAGRGDDGPVAGWTEDAEAQDRTELVERLNLTGVITLDEVGRIHVSRRLSSEDAESAVDFPWGDAARWSPNDDPAMERPGDLRLSDAELDVLFGGQVDEELGDAQDLGWYGLVRWLDEPGGLILKLDENGIRHTWVVAGDDMLAARWQHIASEYSAFYEQRDAYEAATAEPAVTPSGINPKVWVGSLADYNNGDLHGEWFDATCEPTELELAAKFMLRLGHTPNAEEWGIFDYDGFSGAELGEHESFETISRVARGIAEHGEAFGYWAAYVASDSVEQIERFADHYRGEWESFEAYIRDYLEETEFYRFLEQVPEDMRGYVEVDVEQVARDWGCDYHVVETGSGRVWIYELSA